MQSLTTGGATGYLYDADGNRVAKGTVTPSLSPALQPISCDPTVNGFQFTENYVLGMGGEELSTLDGSGNWQRTNVYAGGKLIGTYDLVAGQPALHFHLEDALGTRRMQISGMPANLGQPETDFQSLPFGDQLASYPDACSDADDATPLHFTGKERDAESGNDYFGARYFGSSSGRFLSPDPLGGRLANPQSLNRYSYALNNPRRFTDPTGLYVTNCADGDKACAKNAAAFEKARQHDLKSKNAGIRAAAGAYGNPNDKNGITVAFGDPGKGHNGDTTVTGLHQNSDGSFSAEATVTIRPGQSGAELETTVGHEGEHVEDADGFAATVTPMGYYDLSKNLFQLQTEINAYRISNSILSDEGVKANFGTCDDGPCVLGEGVTNPDATIKQLLANPANGYGLTDANPGNRQFREIRTPNPAPPNPVPQ